MKLTFSARYALFMILLLVVICLPSQRVTAEIDSPAALTVTASSHTFPTFNTGTIIGGAAGVATAMNVASLPADDFLFYTVSADFVAGGNPAWSNSIEMAIDDGGSVVYHESSLAQQGELASEANTTLYWAGVMERPYTGGGNLTITFRDNYDDTSGTYTSELQNVAFTVYPASTPVESFPTFNTGTITGGEAGVATAMNVASLPSDDYLFYTVSADFVAGGNPAWSNTIEMALSNGGSVVYHESSLAQQGELASEANTTLYWAGVMERPYTGGGNLTITFRDNYDDTSGTYTSELQNVAFTIYPANTAALIWAANDCTAVARPCSTSIAQAVSDVAVGGKVIVENSLAAEDVTINHDLLLQSGTSGELTGNGGTAAINVTSGTVVIENLTINAGTSANAIAVSGGAVTIRGNDIDGGGAAGIAQSSGVVTAYANNITNTGGAGVSGSVAAAKNWWGTAVAANKPGGVSTGDWAVRLGSAVADAAFGAGSTVVLGNAQLTGPGPGTGVIISFGNNAANAPFGVGIAPYNGQTCSDYYDFYSTGGTGWTVVLPIDTGTAGCTANTLNQEKVFLINDVSECTASGNATCWDLIPNGQVTIAGNNLEITGLTLAGTHIVAGDSSGGHDPTAVHLQAFTPSGRDHIGLAIMLAVTAVVLTSLSVLVFKRRASF